MYENFEFSKDPEIETGKSKKKENPKIL